MTKILKILFCVILTCKTLYSQDIENPPVRPLDATWDDVCTLPKEIGECKAAVPKYFYNLEKNLCESFTYGGCGGNYNNFDTLIECTAFCSRGGGLLAAPAQPPMPPLNFGRPPLFEESINRERGFQINSPPQINSDGDIDNDTDANTQDNNNNNNKEFEINPEPEIINDDDRGSSGGNRPKWKQNWPIFGGIFAGMYSLLRDLIYW